MAIGDSPTIIVGHLNDKELKESIDSLVAHVAEGTQKMVNNFDSSIESMKKKLAELGTVDVSIGGNISAKKSEKTTKADTDSVEKTISAQDKLVKKNQEVAASYDQVAAGCQKAAQAATKKDGSGNTAQQRVKEEVASLEQLKQKYAELEAQAARRFDVSPIQSLRMRQHELEAGMRTAANEAAKAKKDVDDLNAAIANYRHTIETLPRNQQGFANQQAIQKEINDLVVLRDVAAAEQKKWTDAGQQLRAQYEAVNGEIRSMGRTLVERAAAEQSMNNELAKQLQIIKEIDNAKKARSAFAAITEMPAEGEAQLSAKLTALVELKRKVADTPLLTKANTNMLDWMIGDVSRKLDAIKRSYGATMDETSRKTVNTAQALRTAQETVATAIRRGVSAMDKFKETMESIRQQNVESPTGMLTGIKDLHQAWRDMRNAYFSMSDAEKESPLGVALKKI